MNRFTKFLENNSSGKNILSLFILTNVVYGFMLMVTIPKTMAFSQGMKLLDMMPMGYSHDYVNELLTALGESGRHTYLTSQIPVDMIYPLLFALTYCLLLAYFLKKINKLKSPFTYLCLIPVIAGIADYLENIGIITLLNSYPDLTKNASQITNVFTLLKSVSTTVFFLALSSVLILFGYKKIKKK